MEVTTPNHLESILKPHIEAIDRLANEGAGVIEFDGLSYALISKTELIKILNTLDDQKKDILKVKDVILSFAQMFELTTPDGKHIQPEILNRTKSPIKNMLKGGTNILKLITMAGISPSAEKELNEKFSFLDKIGPVIEKYQ